MDPSRVVSSVAPFWRSFSLFRWVRGLSWRRTADVRCGSMFWTVGPSWVVVVGLRRRVDGGAVRRK
jgi:hypothetical protein